MKPSPPKRIGSRPLWLALAFWLALALPLAHLGAMTHSLSHLGAPDHAPGGEGKHAPQVGCDACTAYAALGGAPPAPAVGVVAPDARLARVDATEDRRFRVELVLAYASRAPPRPLS